MNICPKRVCHGPGPAYLETGIMKQGVSLHNARILTVKPVNLTTLPANPLVSVLILNYNYAQYIGEALDSVLAQTYGKFEVIVCDDGSTDDSCSIIERYVANDARITLIRKPNGGMASALNAACAVAKGEVICLLDADDLYVAVKLEKVVECMTSDNCGMFVHPMVVVDQACRRIQKWPFGARLEGGWLRDKLIRRGGRWRSAPTSGICFRCELVAYLFPLPEGGIFHWSADTFIYTLLPLLTTVGCVDEALAYYRIHGCNALGTRDLNKVKAIKLLDAWHESITRVNERLVMMGVQAVQIDAARNLGIAENIFLVDLLEGVAPRWRLLRTYWVLMRRIIMDDMYTRIRKMAAVILYGVALALPARARPSCVSAFHGFSRWKEILRRVLPVMRN